MDVLRSDESVSPVPKEGSIEVGQEVYKLLDSMLKDEKTQALIGHDKLVLEGGIRSETQHNVSGDQWEGPSRGTEIYMSDGKLYLHMLHPSDDVDDTFLLETTEESGKGILKYKEVGPGGSKLEPRGSLFDDGYLSDYKEHAIEGLRTIFSQRREEVAKGLFDQTQIGQWYAKIQEANATYESWYKLTHPGQHPWEGYKVKDGDQPEVDRLETLKAEQTRDLGSILQGENWPRAEKELEDKLPEIKSQFESAVNQMVPSNNVLGAELDVVITKELEDPIRKLDGSSGVFTLYPKWARQAAEAFAKIHLYRGLTDTPKEMPF